MDKVAQHNNGVKYLLVAVDVLSRYLRVQPMKTLYAKDAVEAFKKMIKKKQPEKVWTDKGSEFKGDFKKLCEKKGIHLYTTESETKSAFAERNIRSLKTSFTNIWKKSGLRHILKITPVCKYYKQSC